MLGVDQKGLEGVLSGGPSCIAQEACWVVTGS